MRIGATADLHGYLPIIPADLDLLLVAGDVYPNRPMLHVFGHIHSGRGVLQRVDGTVTANVSFVGEEYTPQGGIYSWDL